MKVSRNILTFLIIIIFILAGLSSYLYYRNIKLLKERDNLEHSLSVLITKYNELESSLNDLNRSFTELGNSYENLTINYMHWYDYSIGIITLTNSTIKRVLSKSEYLYLKNLLVNKVIQLDNINWWKALQEIYFYISSEIEYVKDESIPLPPKINELLDGSYQNRTFDNSIMTPSETIRLVQGDCDDQAILLYAMIDVYEKYFMGGDTLEWITIIRFSDESWHMAVFIPIHNGKLTIVDPAGHYYTEDGNGNIGTGNAYDELYRYSKHWDIHGGIRYIELYQVIDGKIYRVMHGDLKDTADYIIRTTS